MKLLVMVLVVVFGPNFLGCIGYLIEPEIALNYSFVSYYGEFYSPMIYLFLGVFSTFFGYWMVTRNFRKRNVYEGIKNPFYYIEKYDSFVIFSSVIMGLMFFSLRGIYYIPERIGYHAEIGVELPAFLSTMLGITGLLSIVLLGYSFGRTTGLKKYLVFFVFSIVLVCFYSKASRIFAFSPVIFFLMASIARKSNMKWLFLSLFCMPVLVDAVLVYRGLYNQGFMAFVGYPYDFDYIRSLGSLYLNLSSAYFIFSETLSSAGWQNFSDLYVSLSPLPGSYVGWYDVNENYRINRFVPYSSLGEIFAFSVLLGSLFLMFLGMVVALINANLYRYPLFGMMQAALLLYCCLLMPQYNLRSVMRFLYLLIAIEIAFKLYKEFRTRSVKVKNTYAR